MKLFTHLIAATLLFGAAAGFTANGQEQGSIELKMLVNEVKVVENEDGTQEIIAAAADKIIPGDQVLYTIEYRNVGDEPAEAVVITNPIPANMAYIGDSASGAATQIEFSIDGGKTYGAPDALKVVDADGNERPATAVEYTNVRWVVQSALAPRSGGAVAYRAVLK